MVPPPLNVVQKTPDTYLYIYYIFSLGILQPPPPPPGDSMVPPPKLNAQNARGLFIYLNVFYGGPMFTRTLTLCCLMLGHRLRRWPNIMQH